MKILRSNITLKFFALFTSVLLLIANPVNASTCSYTSYTWNTISKKVVNFAHVNKPYSDIATTEIDRATGCTICEQDQVEVKIRGVPSFKLCKNIATEVKAALEEAISRGQPILNVVGYRVGKTKGVTDKEGNRTQFSNHSFGVAIDVNPDFNGLYTNCIEYSDKCILSKGGAWHPKQIESLTAGSPIVLILKSLGYHWGGEILGRQKDFMHFSISGY